MTWHRGRFGSLGVGALEIPPSVTLYAALSDFAGEAALTSITPQVGDAAEFTIFNSPALNEFGYAMTEATGGANRVNINNIVAAAPGNHVSVLVRQNGTPDTQTIFLGRPGSSTVYAGVAQAGSSSTTQTSGGTSFTTLRVNNGSTLQQFTTSSTRGDVWNGTFGTAGYFVFTFIDLIWPSGGGGDAAPLYYTSNLFLGEADVAGIVKFTDSAEAADVEAKLLSEVGISSSIGGEPAGDGNLGPAILPANTINAAFIEDMAFSGGRFDGFVSDQVIGASPLGYLPDLNKPLGDAVNGIDHGSININTYYSIPIGQGLPRDGSVAVVMFFENKAAYSTGMLFDVNTTTFIGAAESGSGTAATPVGSVAHSAILGRSGVELGGAATRGQVWDAVFAPSNTIKYAAIRSPSSSGGNFRPLQYPGGGGGTPANFTPNVYLKGIITFPQTDWANVQDYIDYGLAKIAAA
jgi:hypothetical protein